MSKFFLRIFIYSFLYHCYLSQQCDNSNINRLRHLKEKKIYYPRILQTLYSDSPSNNYYYTELYVGRNLTRQTYLIDTEIDTISSPCHRCFFCNRNKSNAFYISRRIRRKIKCDSELCSMLPSIGCIYPKNYIKTNQCAFLSTKLNGDGIRGYYIKDHIFFQEDKSPNDKNASRVYASHFIPIGCSLAEFGKYKNLPIDGIMGLNNKEKSFIDILYNLHMLKNNVFSLCLGDRIGYLSLGYLTRKFHKSKKIEYIPILNQSINSYQIQTSAVNVEKIKERNIKAECVIDSGTPITYFPINLFHRILKDIIKYFKKNEKNFFNIFGYHHYYGYCTFFENENELIKQIKSWPRIKFTFSKTEFLWEPENYFYKVNNNEVCLGINNHTFSHIILGSNFMRGKDFIFDKEKNRIGFVEADCSQIISTNNTYNNNNNKNQTRRKNNTIVIKDGIEFLRGRNKELENIKEYNTFNRIVNIIFYSLLTFITCFDIIVIWILYKTSKKRRQYIYNDEHKKLNQFDLDC